MQNDLTVAKTIFHQLGGQQFMAMTGSKNFVGSETTLRMQLGRNKIGAKWLIVELTPMDTYTMTFSKQHPKTWDLIELKKIDRVYHDQLQEIFTEVTGLYTHL